MWVYSLVRCYKLLIFSCLRDTPGGGRGIRTPGTLPGTVVFKTTAIDHSAIPPRRNSQGSGVFDEPGARPFSVTASGTIKPRRAGIRPMLKGRGVADKPCMGTPAKES